MRKSLPAALLLTLLLAGSFTLAQSDPSSAPPTDTRPASTTPLIPPADVLYDDPTATSSATITQILPNSSTSMMTLGAVRRIRVHQEILVVEWGTTATTLLPRQYVGSLTVNKRAENK